MPIPARKRRTRKYTFKRRAYTTKPKVTQTSWSPEAFWWPSRLVWWQNVSVIDSISILCGFWRLTLHNLKKNRKIAKRDTIKFKVDKMKIQGSYNEFLIRNPHGNNQIKHIGTFRNPKTPTISQTISQVSIRTKISIVPDLRLSDVSISELGQI